VREVAAHLSLAHRIQVGTAFKAFVRARGSFDRMVDQTARDEARRPAAELVADLRGAWGSTGSRPARRSRTR
jgi:hypothetical protein